LKSKSSILLMAASICAGIVNVAIVGLLSKFWGIEAVGVLSVVLSGSNIMLPLFTLKLEYGIAQAPSNDIAKNLRRVGFLTSILGVAIIFLLALCISHFEFEISSFSDYATVIAIVALSSSSSALLEASLAREGFFAQVALVKVMMAITKGLGFLSILVLGDSIAVQHAYGASAVATTFSLFIVLLLTEKSSPISSIKNGVKALLEHKQLIYSIPTTTFINAIAANIMPIVLSASFGTGTAGIFFCLKQFIGQPATIVTQSIWKVRYRELALLSTYVSRVQMLLRSMNKYFTISLASFVVLNSFWIVLTGLGVVPEIAWGVVAAFVAMVIVTSLSNIVSYWYLFNRLYGETVANLLVFLLKVGFALALPLVFSDPEIVIIIYCLVAIVIYSLILFSWRKYFVETLKANGT